MGKMMLSVFMGLAIVLAGAPGALALQSGGVEIGDYETGSVVGQPFRELGVDLEFYALENVGGKKVWYPPAATLNLKARSGAPVVFKVTNESSAEHGFFMSADSDFAAPTSMKVELVLKPGETKYVGIPTSDLTYVTAGGVLKYRCHLHDTHIGGTLLVVK
ncbi:MAG: hypothetical protein ACREI3_07110 [Nitrospirales bacterium]